MNRKIRTLLLAAVSIVLLFLVIWAQRDGAGNHTIAPRVEEPVSVSREGPAASDNGNAAFAPHRSFGPGRLVASFPENVDPDVPLWGVTIGPLPPGTYEYYFLRDEEPIVDPLNPSVHEDPLTRPSRQSVFSYPIAEEPPHETGRSSSARESPVPGGRPGFVRFTYRGPISRSLLFMAGFRGGIWGTDEFEPLNDAARDSLRRIEQDRSLCRLSGVVMDEERRPIPDALVRVMATGHHRRTVRTDSRGKFLVDRLRAEYVCVEVRAPMLFMREYECSRLVSGATGTRVELLMARGGAAYGLVRDTSGRPVPGAVVTAEYLEVLSERASRWIRPETWTDPDGRYEFPGLSAGKYAFAARASRLNGLRISPVEILAGRRTEGVDFVLLPGVVVAGRVVTGTGVAERGVPGVRVKASGAPIVPASPPSGIESKEQTVSGEDGWFRLQRLLPGWSYSVTAWKKSWTSGEPLRLELPQGWPPDILTIRMPREGVIAGRVVDRAGLPIAGAWVGVEGRAPDGVYGSQTHRHFSVGLPDAVTTGPDGRFRLGCLGDGASYALVVRAEGYARLQVAPVAADASAEYEFVLSPSLDLSGRVVHAETGEPAVDVQIRMSFEQKRALRWEAVTGPDGEFRLRGLSPGRYLVGGRRDEAFAPLVVQPAAGFEVREGTGNEITLKAFPPVRISGTVRDLDGAPVPGADVTFQMDEHGISDYYFGSYRMELGLFQRGMCDEEGNYEVSGLLHGRLEGSARKEGYVRGQRKLDGPRFLFVRAGTPEVQLSVEPGEVRTGVDFALQREDPAERLGEKFCKGVVLDEDGNPVSGIEVTTYHVAPMWDDHIRLERGQTAMTDSSGRFAIAGVLEKIEGLALVPTKDRPYCGWFKETPPEDEDAIIQATRCGSLSGIVGDSRGIPIPKASVTANGPARWDLFNRHLQFVTTADDHGVFRIPLLPPGKYEVAASKEGFHGGKGTISDCILEPGDGIENPVLVLYGTTEFGGRLVDQDGTPLGGWEVSNNTTTSPDGRFRYQVSTERRTLGFSARRKIRTRGSSNMDASVSFWTGAIDYPNETPDDNQDFILNLGGSVTGRVVYRESRDPAQGLNLSINSPPVPRVEPESFSDCVATHFSVRAREFTGTDGSFEIDKVPPVTFSISFLGKGIAKKTIQGIVVGENQRIDLGVIEVAGGKVVTGRLVDGSTGGPFDRMTYKLETQGMGADVGLRDLPCSPPDPEGAFRIGCVPEEVDTVFFIARRHQDYSAGGWIVMGSYGVNLFGSVTGLDLREADETDIGDVILKGYRVRGRFVDHKTGMPCTPPEDAFIRIQFLGGNRFAAAEFYRERMEMGENGVFVFPSVRPDAVRIRIDVTSFLPVEIPAPPAPDETGLIDIGDVRLISGWTVRGSMKGPGGQPASDAWITITDSMGYRSEGRTDGEGRFEINGLYPGPANLEAGARNADGENPWLGGRDREVQIKHHALTISAGGPTTVDIRFPSPGSE